MTAVTYLVYNQNAKHALLLYCLVVAIYYSMKSLFFASQMTKLVYVPTVISGSFFILLLAATIMSVYYYCKINKNGLTQLNKKASKKAQSSINQPYRNRSKTHVRGLFLQPLTVFLLQIYCSYSAVELNCKKKKK